MFLQEGNAFVQEVPFTDKFYTLRNKNKESEICL